MPAAKKALNFSERTNKDIRELLIAPPRWKKIIKNCNEIISTFKGIYAKPARISENNAHRAIEKNDAAILVKAEREYVPVTIHLFQVKNTNIKIMCEIC